MEQALVTQMTIEEYLEGELRSDIRREFYDGQVYAMAGAGQKHNLISGNLFAAMRQKARGTSCLTFIADMKLYIKDLNCFYYPDLMITCDENDQHEYYKESPYLLIEVLSPSTETIDRREKLQTYTKIASLREYVLVSQEKAEIELYRRTGDNWTYFLLNEPEDKLFLECLDLELDMNLVYEDVF